ncbi:DUF6944 family repetitive protein [Peribacillus butanolivorans]|uniref:DUF6944 family repetitive protein n=1 Tax=Peribacillus butanolivorans TaxID=421767 RepID=UPI00159658CD|nr:hypothetical protein [Peribacillus butanolivorans]
MPPSLGSLVGLTDEFEDNNPSCRAENLIGGLLQGIGNSMLALGGVYQLEKINNKDAQKNWGNRKLDSSNRFGVVFNWTN